MDTKHLAILFPLLSSVFWGLTYALNGRNYGFISLHTGMIITAIGYLFAAALIGIVYKTPPDFTPFFSEPKNLWLWAALPSTMLAASFLHLGIKNVSPSYAAIAEVAYVIFTPVFAYVLFGQKQWSPSMLIGAAFIFIGLFIVVFGQAQKSP